MEPIYIDLSSIIAISYILMGNILTSFTEQHFVCTKNKLHDILVDSLISVTRHTTRIFKRDRSKRKSGVKSHQCSGCVKISRLK